MEPIAAIVIGILTIIFSGYLAKVGENLTDRTGDLAKFLWAMLKRKLPDHQTVKLPSAKKKIDIQKAVIDLETISNDVSDPEVVNSQVNIGKQVNFHQTGNNNNQNNNVNL